MKRLMMKFRRDEKGVTLVEYGIALVLAIGVGTGALTLLGDAVDAKMDEGTAALAPAVP